MTQAGTVWVDVRGDTSFLTRDIAAAAAAGAGLLLAGVGAAAVRESTEFNKAVSGVGAVANATAADLETLRVAALQAGADTAFSATEAATAEVELAKAGIGTAQILGGALAGALDLAAAGQLGLNEAATVTAQALNTFNLDASQATTVADTLAAGANKSAADVSQLGQALAQGGLVAKQTGLSLQDTVGVLALFADNALIGSDAGTSLKTALQRLVPQSDEAKASMESLGLSFFDSGGNFIGIAAAAQELQDSLGGLNTEQRQSALTTIFGADAIRAASLLYEAGADGVNEYTAAVNDQGAAQRVAAAQLDNLSGDLEKLRGSFDTLLIGLGSSADSGLRDIVQAATDGVNALGEFVQSPVFDEFASEIGDGLGSIADGIENVSDTLSGSLNGLDATGIRGLFADLRSDAEGLEGPILGAAAALATLAGSKLSFGLLPGLSPLQGILAGVVLQSEEGRDALDSLFEVVADGAEAAAPLVGLLADGLGFLADQGDLVAVALNAFVAFKIASTITPWIGSVKGLADGFALLGQKVSAIAATQGVSKLTALRGVIGSSASEGLTGALGAAGVATLGLTAAIGGGLYLYQQWADANKKVEDRARALTDALLEQSDVTSGEQIARVFTGLLDASETADLAFLKVGRSVSSVSKLIDENAGAIVGLRSELEDSAQWLPDEQQIAALPEGIREYVAELVRMVETGQLLPKEFQALLAVLGDVDAAVQTSGENIRVQAQRFKEEADGAELSAAAHEKLNTALNSSDVGEARDALSWLIAAYPELAAGAAIAGASSQRAAQSTRGVGEAAQFSSGWIALFGQTATDTSGALDLLAGSSDDALGGMLSLVKAKDAVGDANQRVADAQEKLTDILNSNTEGVRNAREALADAQDALAKARSDVGPGSKASRDAARELRDARKALRDAEIDAGREPEAGDFFEDRRDAVLDALERVAEAQEKLAEINSGTSDQVISAQERVADAQRRLGEEMEKVGPKSRAARDAQEELDDAQLQVIESAQNEKDAIDALTEDSVPAAIAQLQQLGDQHLLTKDQVDQMIGSLLIERALIETPYNVPPAPTPTTPTPTGPRPGLANADRNPIDQQPYVPPTRPGRINAGRAFGGNVWDDGVTPVNELGTPEVFTDRAGSQYLIPTEGGGSVEPLDQMLGALLDELRRLGDRIERASQRPAEPLAPLLRSIEENTRHDTPAGRSPADVRALTAGVL